METIFNYNKMKKISNKILIAIKKDHKCGLFFKWLRVMDLNQRPSGYEPDELPDCSNPRY